MTALLLWLLVAWPAHAGPPELDGVGLDARPGALLPLDAPLTDPDGLTRPLGAWLDGRPALLVLATYRCRMLCGVIVREAAAAVEALPGPEPLALVVSFDPRDDATTAREARGALGWPFLRAAPDDVERLLEATGMRIRFDEATGQYAHPAAVFVISPSGRLSSVVAGPRPDPGALARALAAARDERAERGVLGAILSCFRWEPAERAAAPAARRFLRVGGLLVFGGFGALWLALVLGRGA